MICMFELCEFTHDVLTQKQHKGLFQGLKHLHGTINVVAECVDGFNDGNEMVWPSDVTTGYDLSSTDKAATIEALNEALGVVIGWFKAAKKHGHENADRVWRIAVYGNDPDDFSIWQLVK